MERTHLAPYLLLGLSLSGFLRLADQERNDFLRIHFIQTQHRNIRMVENGLLSVPFLLFFLWHGQWWVAILQLLVAVMMVFLPINRLGSSAIPTPFSRQPYELATGFRKTLALYLGCCFLAVMGHLAANYSLMLFAMVLPAFVSMGFYGKPEPGFFIWIHAFTPKAFLNRKLSIATQQVLLLMLPLLLYCLLIFPERWWLTLLLTVLGTSYVLLMIVAKYAAYPEEIDLRRSFLMAIAMLLPPVLVLVFLLFYRQAQRKLMLFLP